MKLSIRLFHIISISRNIGHRIFCEAETILSVNLGYKSWSSQKISEIQINSWHEEIQWVLQNDFQIYSMCFEHLLVN